MRYYAKIIINIEDTESQDGYMEWGDDIETSILNLNGEKVSLPEVYEVITVKNGVKPVWVK